MATTYVAVLIGCLECGNESSLIGVFDNLDDAKRAAAGLWGASERDIAVDPGAEFDWGGEGQLVIWTAAP